MQGFYQIASFNIAREPVASEEGDFAVVDYILVSRRSRDRAGLRYQRRGIDDDANVANFVETETIMRVEVSSFCHNAFACLADVSQREGFSNVFSHVQIRGSSRSSLSFQSDLATHLSQFPFIGNKRGTA